MTRTKYTIALMAALAVGLLAVKLAVSADGPGPKAPAAGESWDDGGPMPVGGHAQVAQRDPDDFGPPGPPPGRGPGQGRGPQADRGQPQGPPPDAGPGGSMGPPDQGRMWGQRGPDGMRSGGGMAGPGPGMHPPMGPGMGPDMPPLPPGAETRERVVIRRGEGPGPQVIGTAGPFGDMFYIQKNDPELFALLKKDMDLERESHELAMQYRQASTADRDKLKEQIAEVVAKHFDVRQQRRTLELKRMEAKLKELREAIDHRGKARKDIVERRISELTGQDDTGF